MEAWKSTHVTEYPFQMKENNPNRYLVDREVRPNTIKNGKTMQEQKQQKKACAKLWNIAPTEITNAATKPAAKREIKRFSRSLEI